MNNGSEFCGHEMVAERLKTDIYPATPYSSWERELNEKFNDLLRHYILKGKDLRTVTGKQIADAERHSMQSRESLGSEQHIAVFDELLKAT